MDNNYQSGTGVPYVQCNYAVHGQCPYICPTAQPYMQILHRNPKERLAYVVLGAILGYLGVHNFYAGYVGRGIAQLLITLLSLGILFFIPFIWAIIEICTIERDAYGIPFSRM